jgi:hypothetical protein
MAADDRLSGARNLGGLNGIRVVRNSVGFTDKNDYYTFKITNRSSFSLLLNKLQNNVDVALLQNRKVISSSKRVGRKPEAIAATLEAGTYHLRVYRRQGESKYRLRLQTTPLPPSPPSLPPPSTLPQVSRRFLSLFSSTSSSTVGSINPTNGIFSTLPNSNIPLTDIASYTDSDLFGITFNSLYKIDPTVGTLSFVGNLGVFVNSLGFAPSGVLYATGGSNFYTVDSVKGTASLVANIPGFSSSGDLTYDSTSGRFLATSTNGTTDTLFSIGLGGDARLVGNIGFNNVWGLFFNNGTLYGYTNDKEQIVIDPTTGLGTFNQLVTGLSGQIGGAT